MPVNVWPSLLARKERTSFVMAMPGSVWFNLERIAKELVHQLIDRPLKTTSSASC
jgi:hypothetical protein